MSPPTAKFNVGGTMFEVAVSTIQSQPDGLLAKMIDGRFPCGKDESGAYFIDRNSEFFNIVLDVHRDNKLYPLPPGFTRERVVAELEFYGLQDFFEAGAPIDLSVESTVRSMLDAQQSLQKTSGEFSQWQLEQKSLGDAMVTEGLARLCMASAKLDRDQHPGTLRIPSLQVTTLPQMQRGVVSLYLNAAVSAQVVKLFDQINTQVTVAQDKTGGQQGSSSLVEMKAAAPKADA